MRGRRRVRIGNLPALARARIDAHPAQGASASRPDVTCSPEDTDRVVFARIVQRSGFPAPAYERIGGAGHCRHDHGHLVARIHFAFDVPGNAANALNISDRGAAELHHQAGHNELAHLCGTGPGTL